MSGYATLRVEERDDRVVVTLARPEKRNAIGVEMVDELHQVCDRLERDPKLLLVTGGTDGIFAAGADIAELRDRDRYDALAGINHTVFARIRALPMPSVAAVDGPALGGGAELSYACDIRVCTDRAFFGQPEVRLGIVAGAGALHRLPQLVGESLAKELLYTGRRLTAADALAVRLVSAVVPPAELLATAHGVLDRIARNSSLAVRLTKLAVDSPADAHPQVERLAQAVLFEDAEKYRRMDDFLSH
jgi:enoyl-CoA hydratase/carnithine racemase